MLHVAYFELRFCLYFNKFTYKKEETNYLKLNCILRYSKRLCFVIRLITPPPPFGCFCLKFHLVHIVIADFKLPIHKDALYGFICLIVICPIRNNLPTWRHHHCRRKLQNLWPPNWEGHEPCRIGYWVLRTPLSIPYSHGTMSIYYAYQEHFLLLQCSGNLCTLYVTSR